MTERNWYQAYMTDGERVMWESEAGRGGLSLRWMDTLRVIATLGFGSWGVMMLCLVLRDKVPDAIGIFMIVVIGLWLGMMLYQFVGPWWRRQRGLHQASYVITDRRILRCRAGVVDGLLLSQLPEPVIREEADGHGTICFWPEAANNQERGSCRANLGNLAGFELRRITHVREVCELLHDLQAKPVPMKTCHEAPFVPLEKGERLLWQGRPDARQCWQSANRENLLGSLWAISLAGGFDVMTITLMGWRADLWPVHLFCLFGVLVGAAMGLIPFLLSYRKICLRAYVLTDSRVLLRDGRYTSEKRLDRGESPLIYLAQGREGTATLMLATLPADGAGRRAFTRQSAESAGYLLAHVCYAAQVMDMVEAAAGAENRSNC